MERQSPPFIPKKHRDGAEVAEKREGWGTLKYVDARRSPRQNEEKARRTEPQGKERVWCGTI